MGCFQINPLVYCLTNEVTSNFVANALLAVGSSPIMSRSQCEVRALCRKADALVLNIGTADVRQALLMLRAGRMMHRLHKPIVLDPVGAGATSFRTRLARLLLCWCSPTVLRGNASEIMAVAGAGHSTHGVDSALSGPEAWQTASEVARRYGCTVVVSGATDFITDGTHSATVDLGSPLQAQVTGMGCVATAVIGAVLAQGTSPFKAAWQAMARVGAAGASAAQHAAGPGTMIPLFVDLLNGEWRNEKGE